MPATKETQLIIRLREDVSKLRADQKRAMSVMRKHKSELQGIGKQMSTTITSAFGAYAVIGGMRTAIKSIAEMEMQMSKVKAVSGANEDQFKRLKKNALDLGRETKFTAGEVAQLQLELSKLGFAPEQILASTNAIRKLATVADTELGESAKTMAGTLNSFNLSATESERVANIMAESFSKSALDLEKFTVATANSGSIANVFGHTIEQNTARIGALVDANIDASKAGTDLRKIYLELNKAGLSYDQAMQKIISSSDRGGTAQALFGDRAAGAAVILAEQQEKVRGLTGELSDANMEMDSMVAIMEDNLITDFDKLGSAIDGAAQRGGGFIDVLRAITQTASGAINSLGTTDLDKQFEKAGIDVGITGPSSEDVYALFEFNRELKKSVERQKDLILNGSDIFGGVELSALAAKDQITEINKRLSSMSQYSYFEDLKIEIQGVVESLKQQVSETERLADEQRKLMAVTHSKNRGASNITGAESLAAPSIEGGVTLPNLTITPEMIDAAIEANASEFARWRESIITEIDILNADINAILRDRLANAIAGIAEVIGSGGNIGDAFKVVMGVIADGMAQLGKTMIAYGVAQLAFQKALKSLNPVAAIAAGGLMVAAASALKSAQSSFSSSVSGGGGGSADGASGPTGRFQSERSGQSQPIRLKGELELSGRKLKWLIDQEENFDKRNVG